MKTYKLKNTDVPSHATHPGSLLADEIKHREITQKKLAEKTGLSPSEISKVMQEKIPVRPEFAYKVGEYLNIAPEYIMRIQYKYDARIAYQKKQEEIRKAKIPEKIKQKILGSLPHL